MRWRAASPTAFGMAALASLVLAQSAGADPCAYLVGDTGPPACDGSVLVLDTGELPIPPAPRGDVVIDEVKVGTRPVVAVLAPDGRRLFVVNGCGDVGQCSGYPTCSLGSVWVVDTQSNEVIAKVPLAAAYPIGIAFASTGHAYVYNGCGDSLQCARPPTPFSTVTVIDTKDLSIVGEVIYRDAGDVNCGPHGLTTSPDGSIVYVTCGPEIKIIDAAAFAQDFSCRPCAKRRPIPLSFNAKGIVLTADGSRAYVVGISDPILGQASVQLIDLAEGEVMATIPVGSRMVPLMDIVMSPDGRFLYVSTGEVIDTASNQVVDKFDRLDDARGLDLTPDGTRLLAAGEYEVAVFDALDSSVRPHDLYSSLPEHLDLFRAVVVGDTEECPPLLPTLTPTAGDTPMPTPTATALLCDGDLDGDQRVTIAELIRAVNSSLYGCPGALPTPTRTPK